MNNSTRTPRKKKTVKPAKPYADFPLFPHATKRWAKKIKGRMVYFGPWSDPDAALAKYQEQRDDLYAGRTPRVQGDGLTIRDLVNRFLNAKRRLKDAGEIAWRTFEEHKRVGLLLAKFFGVTRLVTDLAVDDFERLRAALAETRGPKTLANEIQRIRTVFKYGYDAGLVDHPMRYGQGFDKPSRRTLRLARAAKGPMMFEAEEIRRMLGAAGVQLKAMILLGINCGFGNGDCGGLRLHHLDLAGGWVNYPRPKTGIQRRCALWPETVAAIRDALAKRPAPKEGTATDLVFVTQKGHAWAKETAENPVSKETRKLLDAIGVNGARNFYALRHTFETIGGEARDQVAVNHIMGHSDGSMAATYRERISDERLRAVAEHVRQWLFSGVNS
jgi:integrase